MSHPFGDLVSQHLHRKHGLSQARLAAGIQQDPSVITEMCKGRRLTGPQARERVVAIVHWLHRQETLATQVEAGALLMAAGLAPLNAHEPVESQLLSDLAESLSSSTSQLTIMPPRAVTPPTYALPASITPFVGRERELVDILSRLRDPACRLLTLLGPGGVGKSRLAIEAARRLALADGAMSGPFVQLAQVDSSEGISGVIARALQFTVHGEVPIHQQLLDYLRERPLLLILDNAEQVTASALYFADLLVAAPQLRLLVTSREALNLQEEWVYEVEGMTLSVAGAAPAEAAADSDAMLLFAQCARRVRADFGLASDRASAQHICALVEGMPLGIELAASWITTLPINVIVRELEHSVDILTTRAHNAPERHRSVRIVFEHTWQRLEDPEQQALMRLAVLCGFRLEAAEQVGGATMSILAALVDKSLLRITHSGRYHMHTLLRQLAEEKLRAESAAHAETLARHSSYYLAFVAGCEHRLAGAERALTLDELDQESDNVRMAWLYAVQQGDVAALASALKGLHKFYDTRSRFDAGENLLTQAAHSLNISGQVAHELLLTRILSRQVTLATFMEAHAEASHFLDQTLHTFRQLNRPVDIAFVLNGLGHFAISRGDIKEAIQCFEQSLAISRAMGDEIGATQTLNQLGRLRDVGQGDAQTNLMDRQESQVIFNQSLGEIQRKTSGGR